MSTSRGESPSTHVLRGTVVTPDQVLADGVVVVDGEVLRYVGPAKGRAPELVGLALPEPADNPVTILPGLVDIHCHGGGGASFPDSLTAEQARQAASEHLKHGTTSLCASLVTQAPETIRARVAVLTELAEAGELAGIHLEGPFLSEARCGAQDPELMQTPSPELVREVAALAHGHFTHMTIAAEIAGNLGEGGVTQALIESGALPSYGHSDAAHGETRAGLEEAYQRLAAAGVRSRRPLVNHLFNGMRPLQHREAGPIPDALAAARKGEAVVELVADGTHLNPALVREVFEIVGRENITLITDAMAAAGMPDGSYQLGSMAVTVEGGVARLVEGGAIAGGTAHLLDVVRTTVRGGVPLVDAVYAASLTPSVVLGRADIGALEAGRRADVLVVDDGLRALKVLRAGVRVA